MLGYFGEQGGAITRAATQVEHALAGGIPACQRVAGKMFVQKIGVDLAGDNALAGEPGFRLGQIRQRAVLLRAHSLPPCRADADSHKSALRHWPFAT